MSLSSFHVFRCLNSDCSRIRFSYSSAISLWKMELNKFSSPESREAIFGEEALKLIAALCWLYWM